MLESDNKKEKVEQDKGSTWGQEGGVGCNIKNGGQGRPLWEGDIWRFEGS